MECSQLVPYFSYFEILSNGKLRHYNRKQTVKSFLKSKKLCFSNLRSLNVSAFKTRFTH
jgi:hypothetical protein